MEWIKKNYDRFILLLLAVMLLGSSGALFWFAKSFPERFAPALAEVPHGQKVISLETAALERVEASLQKPALWNSYSGSLLVSREYVEQRDASGQANLVEVFREGSAPLHPPVPNEWWIKNGFKEHILEADLLEQDPDKDGFSNLDEYLGKTDPTDPNSHPAYVSKLRLKQYIKVPFRLKFEADAGDGSYQIRTLDVRQPTVYVKVGEVIPNTKFKVEKFEKKSTLSPATGEEKDVSELTVQHVTSGISTPLVIDVVTDIPDQFARFAFLWDHTEFTVKKGEKFALKPEPNILFKLIDIRDNEAVINSAKTDGDPIKVPRLE